jgi:hypothetical protein
LLVKEYTSYFLQYILHFLYEYICNVICSSFSVNKFKHKIYILFSMMNSCWWKYLIKHYLITPATNYQQKQFIPRMFLNQIIENGWLSVLEAIEKLWHIFYSSVRLIHQWNLMNFIISFQLIFLFSLTKSKDLHHLNPNQLYSSTSNP